MPQFDVVFVETTRITKTIEADTLAEAYAIAERRWDTDGFWDGSDEESEGTDGVEEISLDDVVVWSKGDPEPGKVVPIEVIDLRGGCSCGAENSLPEGNEVAGPHHDKSCPEFVPF